MVAIMREVLAIGRAVGVDADIDPEARIDMARELGPFKTSMLQDLEAGKPLEIDGLLTGTLEVARKAGVRAPFTESLFGLIRARALIHRAVRDEATLAWPAVPPRAASCRAWRNTPVRRVEACRAYAQARAGSATATSAKDVVFERDQALCHRALRAARLGNQFVSSILTGNGAIVLRRDAQRAELSLRLPARRRQARGVLPLDAAAERLRARAVHARRGAARQVARLPGVPAAGRRAGPDRRSTRMRFQEAHEGGEKTLAAYRKANDEWREYRDAECARRREVAPKGVSAEDAELACVVELTRQRGRDMR